MRIAIVNEMFQAGATRCARDLERGLQPAHELKYFPESKSDTPATLFRKLRAYKPDIVHCHSFYGQLPYHFLANVSRRYPTCFTPHDPRPVGTFQTPCWDCRHNVSCYNCPLLRPAVRYSGVLNRYFRMRSKKRLVHYATAPRTQIIAPSRWLEERMRETEMRRFRIHHIPYGIDGDRFRRVPDARALLGLPEDRKIVLHVAYEARRWEWNQRKGMNYLAEAFVEIVLPVFPDALMIVVGEGLIPNHPSMRPMSFVANDGLPVYYSAADVYAAPTLADNLPYTVLEAMACETPVVASAVGGVPEQVEDGKTGFLVTPRDPAALGAAILKILRDDGGARAMGRASRQRVLDTFGMTRFLERHEELYRQLVA